MLSEEMPMCRKIAGAYRRRLVGLVLLSGPIAWCQIQNDQNTRGVQRPAAGQLRIPNRPSTPIFKGEQGKQRTDIQYDPATGLVTIKLLVQDPNGYFIPSIRRENFVIYEDGVRRSDAMVEVEHAAVSLGLLMEYGGGSLGLYK